MFDRLKQILVESFVGAIALGWMLAQIIAHSVSIFATPVASWITRREYRGLGGSSGSVAQNFSWQPALPELIRAILLLLIWYALLRWLYFTPAKGSDKAFPDEESNEQLSK